jgi:hypothetical protein
VFLTADGRRQLQPKAAANHFFFWFAAAFGFPSAAFCGKEHGAQQPRV